jgi:hypothetical protein
MKQSEAIKKVKEIETSIELCKLEKLRQMEAEMDLENRESNRNRARSVTVGTAFGGTTELMMRSDGGRHIWCAMQPVEVIELIYQLAANVGCNVALKPRDDFASWRDWRVSEAEKKHLNGHAPLVNDMALFQKLGASGYNDEEAKKIMDILANVKGFANENDDARILLQETKAIGAPNLMIGEQDSLLHNKVVLHDNKVVHMAGGNGGVPHIGENENEALATETSVNGRSSK